MHAEDFFINDRCHRHAVEAICEYFPQPDIESSFTFIIEAIDTVYGSTFMVSPKKEKVLRVLHLVGQKKTYCLKTLLSTVHIIT